MIIRNYYIARLDIRQCLADIRINDVPFLRQNVEEDLTAEMPVNYLIESSGIQELTVQMSPKLGDSAFLSGAKCQVEIWRYDGSEYTIVPIEQVCSSSLSVNEAEKMLPLKYEKHAFVADVPYQIARWSDCEVFKDTHRIASAVGAFYTKFGRLLANKQYSQYMELVKDRESNICKALLLGEEEANTRNQMLFECLDDGFVLQPLKGGKHMQFYANKRIVTVLDNDMRPALRFYNEETEETLAIELLLGIKKGQKELCII